MRLEELKAMAENDSHIDYIRLDVESLRIASLHSKWYMIFIDELKSLRGLEGEYKKLRLHKFEYYLGKRPDEEYSENPLHHKVLKSDIDIYLDGDSEINALLNKFELQKIKVRFIEDFIRQINQRSFNIKNAIEFQKFKLGVT